MAYYKSQGGGQPQHSKKVYNEYELTWRCDPQAILRNYESYDAITFIESVNMEGGEKYVMRYYDGGTKIESYSKKTVGKVYMVDNFSCKYKEAIEKERKLYKFFVSNVSAVARWKIQTDEKDSIIDVTVKCELGAYSSDSIPVCCHEDIMGILLNKNQKKAHILYGDFSYESSSPFDIQTMIDKYRPDKRIMQEDLIDRVAQHNAIVRGIRPGFLSAAVMVRPLSIDLDSYQKLNSNNKVHCMYSAKPDGAYSLVITMKNASKPHLFTSGTQTIFIPAKSGPNVNMTAEDLINDCMIYQGEFFETNGLFVLYGILSATRITVSDCMNFTTDDVTRCKTGPIKNVIAKQFFSKLKDIALPEYKTDGYIMHVIKEDTTMKNLEMFKIKEPVIDTIDIGYEIMDGGKWARPLCMSPKGNLIPFVDPLAEYDANLCINVADLYNMPPIVEANFSHKHNKVEILNGRPDKTNPNKFVIWFNKCCNNVMPIIKVIEDTESKKQSGAHSAKFLPRTRDLISQNAIIRSNLESKIFELSHEGEIVAFDWGAGKLGYFSAILNVSHLFRQYCAYDVSLQDLLTGICRIAKTSKNDNDADFIMNKYRIYTEIPDIEPNLWISVFAVHYLVDGLKKECHKAKMALKYAKNAAGGFIVTHDVDWIAKQSLPIKIGTTTWNSIVKQKDGTYTCFVVKDYASTNEAEEEIHYGLEKYKEMFKASSQIISRELSVISITW